MSEFNFSCPACGRNISYDTAQAGTAMACPLCNASITVPDISAHPDIPPPWTGHNGTTAQRTSRLAVASLVCSLSSFFTCIGWLPGIICGHLAKTRMRRNSSLKGQGLATAGLAIGYLALALEAGTVGVKLWQFSTAMKHGFENARQELKTNSLIVTHIQTPAASSNTQRVEPTMAVAVVATNPPAEPAPSEWTSDPANSPFPDHQVSGRLHGIDFNFRTALLRRGSLLIRGPNGMVVEVFRLSNSIEDQTYAIEPSDGGDANPRVRMTWNEGDGVMTATYAKGYGMKLQINQAHGQTVSAKIYLCFPDDSKSWVAGTFQARAPKQQ